MSINVRAIKAGYYGLQRRKEGDEFAIESDEEFSTLWMEKMSTKDVKASAKKKEEFEEKMDDGLSGPDVRHSMLDKYGDDLKTDSTGKNTEQKLVEGAEKARKEAEAEEKKRAAADDRHKGKK